MAKRTISKAEYVLAKSVIKSIDKVIEEAIRSGTILIYEDAPQSIKDARSEAYNTVQLWLLGIDQIQYVEVDINA